MSGGASTGATDDTACGVVVGVDIGGTKVLAGIVDADGRVGRTARRTTPGRRVVAIDDTPTPRYGLCVQGAGRLAGARLVQGGFRLAASFRQALERPAASELPENPERRPRMISVMNVPRSNVLDGVVRRWNRFAWASPTTS